MKEVLVRREDVLKAMEAQVRREDLSKSCAMYQALVPFIKGSFTVIDNKAYDEEDRIDHFFTPHLPEELYTGQYDIALAKIEKNGPYRFQVEGLE